MRAHVSLLGVSVGVQKHVMLSNEADIKNLLLEARNLAI